jgi:hypothetical protein
MPFRPREACRCAYLRIGIRKGLLEKVLRKSHALLIGYFKAISAAIIRIVNLFGLLLSSELPKYPDLGFSAGTLIKPLKITEIVAVLLLSVILPDN